MLLVVGAAVAVAQDPGWTLAPSDESAFVANINAARAANGLGPLTVDTNMRAAARDWAVWMAENDTLQHASNIVTGAPSNWTKVGENVGKGGSVSSVWNAFMASPGHAANVLDPLYTRVGVGMVWADNGVLWTTHRFAAASSDSPPPATPTPAPAPTPTASTPPPPPPPTATAAPTATAVPTPEPTPEPSPTEVPPVELAFVDEDEAPTPARTRATMTILLASLHH